jgi:hypothetical protein
MMTRIGETANGRNGEVGAIDLNRLHSKSLAFANREVQRCKQSVKRAMTHAQETSDIEIHALREFADHQVAVALMRYRAAIGKRAFEIRQLTNSVRRGGRPAK